MYITDAVIIAALGDHDINVDIALKKRYSSGACNGSGVACLKSEADEV